MIEKNVIDRFGRIAVRAAEHAVHRRLGDQAAHVGHRHHGSVRVPHRHKALLHNQLPRLIAGQLTDIVRRGAPHLQDRLERALDVAEDLLLAIPRHAAGRAAFLFKAHSGAVSADPLKAKRIDPRLCAGGFAKAGVAGEGYGVFSVLHAGRVEGNNALVTEAAFEGGAEEETSSGRKLFVIRFHRHAFHNLLIIRRCLNPNRRVILV